MTRLNLLRFLMGGATLLGALVAAVFDAFPFAGPVSRADVTPSRRTHEEQQLVDDLARLRGRPLTEQKANFAIVQARAFGDL